MPQRELRNNVSAVLRRAEAGEHMTITVDGRPVATLGPIGRRPQWITATPATWERIRQSQADPGLRAELADALPDTTDDIVP